MTMATIKFLDFLKRQISLGGGNQSTLKMQDNRWNLSANWNSNDVTQWISFKFGNGIVAMSKTFF